MTTGGQINISGLSVVDAWLALTTTPNLHVLTNGVYRQQRTYLAGDSVTLGAFPDVTLAVDDILPRVR